MTELATRPTAPSGGWRTATVVTVRHPTPRAVELRLDVPDRVDHLPGQHYVVRLTAPAGYRAQRSYPVASAPDDPHAELCVGRLVDGDLRRGGQRAPGRPRRARPRHPGRAVRSQRRLTPDR